MSLHIRKISTVDIDTPLTLLFSPPRRLCNRNREYFDLIEPFPALTNRVLYCELLELNCNCLESTGDCCQWKVVGGENYQLIHEDNQQEEEEVMNGGHGCKDNCIYKK